MSVTFSGSKVTLVQPVAFTLDNFGPEVASVTFRYGTKDHTINRLGKSNVKGFSSHKQGTYTLTNGKKTFRRMVSAKFAFISMTYTDGRVESMDYVPTF